MLSLFILVPLAVIILVNLPFSFFKRRGPARMALALALLQILVIACGADFLRGGYVASQPFSRFFPAVDSLSLVMLLAVGMVTATTLLVGDALIRDQRQKFNFANVLLIAFIGMNGTVLLTDIFSLYVFIEVTSIASFILIAMDRDKDGLEGAFKYIVLSIVASLLMLSGIALLLLAAGDTSFAAIHRAVVESAGSWILKLAAALLFSGLFIKAGLAPFHGWLPDAYSAAPAPTSIFLAGIATKVMGVYTLIRLTVTVFGAELPFGAVLMFIGTVSILAGALAALGQRDFKRMLAYSSISQVGYIILALGCGTDLALAGAIFHLFNHAVFKSLLFVNAAAIEEQTGSRDMDILGGLAQRMPVTGTTSVVGLLSISGIPPFAGFWSKLLILIALWQAGDYAYAVIAVLAGVLTLAYFLMMQRKVFFGKVRSGLENVTEAGSGLLVPAVLLALVTFALGILFPWLLNTFLVPIRNLL